MRGTGDKEQRWNFAARWIPGIPVDRAELRLTGTYKVMPGLFVGLEYNPLADDLGLLANWRVIDETAHRPMLMIGTSSDRIGTPTGRAYYATFAKDLASLVDVPIAPYFGTAYGEYDDKFELIGGLGIRWRNDLISTHSYDGYNLHHMLDWYVDSDYRIGVVLAQQGADYYAGLSVGLGL